MNPVLVDYRDVNTVLPDYRNVNQVLPDCSVHSTVRQWSGLLNKNLEKTLILLDHVVLLLSV